MSKTQKIPADFIKNIGRPFIGIHELIEAFRDDASSRSLLLSNLITIFLAVIEHWSLKTVMLIYWGQNIIIGIFNVIRILASSGISSKDGKLEDIPSAVKFFLAGFFAIHYGGFHYGYFSFLRFSPGPDDLWITVSLLAFFAHHLFSFLYNYKEEREKLDVIRMMFFPYQRIVPMHMTIILGGFFMMLLRNQFADQLVLIFFLILKTNTDVKMHQIEHALKQSNSQIV
jgi:hypothetical protein